MEKQAMTHYRQARLVSLEHNEASHEVVMGDAIMRISRGHRGEMEVSGTFRSQADELSVLAVYPFRLYRYEGFALEGERDCRLTVTVLISEHEDGIYELRSNAEPSDVEWSE